MQVTNKALFLDRDGVINHDYGHVNNTSEFDFIDGIFEVCNYFLKLDFIIIVVTNQAGIGKRFYTLEQFQSLNKWMIKQFEEKGIVITKTYYCPHIPEDNCNCRKPKPGMILEAIAEFNLDLSKSILIGDRITDIEAGKAAGIGKLLLFNENNHNNTLTRIEKILF